MEEEEEELVRPVLGLGGTDTCAIGAHCNFRCCLLRLRVCVCVYWWVHCQV